MQEQQAEDIGNLEGSLMESWPDDPAEGILASALRAMAPDNESEVGGFPDGSTVIREGDPFLGIYKIRGGAVELETYEEIQSESDEEDEEVRTKLLVFTSFPFIDVLAQYKEHDEAYDHVAVQQSAHACCILTLILHEAELKVDQT